MYGSRHVPVYAQHDYGGQLTGEAHSQTVTLVDGVGLDDPRQEQSADLPESRLVEHFPVVAQLHLAVQVVDSGSAPLLAGERRDAAPAA
ncbi:hypothetical protein [Kitasatospora sp. NPDC090091]|uniref:hypothetical protein n=1 Tax=Kitasatospora sp. NPDC090091 TaxID=3364081 RepID=UPI00381C656F